MARVAVVTGGIGGLGTAMCRALVAQGRTVVATYYPSQEEWAREWRESRQAEGFARAVAFLTAEETGYITGANLAVNGGSYFH
jgi:acetoacetyl-CoA reductase